MNCWQVGYVKYLHISSEIFKRKEIGRVPAFALISMSNVSQTPLRMPRMRGRHVTAAQRTEYLISPLSLFP